MSTGTHPTPASGVECERDHGSDGSTLRIGSEKYDVDLLRSLADRDTPASIVAQAALDVGMVEPE